MAPAPSRAAASTWTQSMKVIDAANRSPFSAGWPVRTKLVEPGPDLIGVIELSLSLVFGYVDQTLGQVLAEAQREREEVIGGALARRAETIRLILDGAPIDPATASRRIGYELTHRHHTALVRVVGVACRASWRTGVSGFVACSGSGIPTAADPFGRNDDALGVDRHA